MCRSYVWKLLRCFRRFNKDSLFVAANAHVVSSVAFKNDLIQAIILVDQITSVHNIVLTAQMTF